MRRLGRITLEGKAIKAKALSVPRCNKECVTPCRALYSTRFSICILTIFSFLNMSSSTRALFNGNTGPTWEDEVKELNKQLKEAKYLSGFHGDALIGVSHSVGHSLASSPVNRPTGQVSAPGQVVE
jgi:hypothetical protein